MMQMKAVLARAMRAVVLLAPLANAACSHELGKIVRFDWGDDAESTDIVWDELMEDNESAFAPRPEFPLASVTPTPLQLARLPSELQASPELARLAVSRDLEAPVVWENGVYGQIGTARLYVTSTTAVPTYERLYWVMVKMLSEKYGCFMVEKQNFGDTVTKVRCRDKRQIVMWRSQGEEWIQFYARQYDRDGYEIVVRKKRIVRVGLEPQLY